MLHYPLFVISALIKLVLCKIWDFHGGDYEECRVLGCGAMHILWNEPTFLRNVGSFHRSTRRHIPEHGILHNLVLFSLRHYLRSLKTFTRISRPLSPYSDGLDGQASNSGRGLRLFSIVSTPTLGPTKPPIQWVAEALSAEVKRLGREADKSLPSSAEVKNGGAIPPTPTRLHGVVLN
jgi:hypothetical protein